MDFILSAIPYFMYWGSTMFILASASPRRRALLRQIGARFVSVPSGATEELKEYVPNDTVLRNALLKARTVAAEYPEHAVLGADTAIVVNRMAFGKPKDAADARRMLSVLAGREHVVMTGIAWVVGEHAYTAIAETKVHFAPMTDAEIARYVASGEPMGKAGGYAIQGQAAMYIREIHGSFSNVVGLPLYRVTALAKEAGVCLNDNEPA